MPTEDTIYWVNAGNKPSLEDGSAMMLSKP